MSDVLANGLNVNVNIQPSAEPDAGHIEVNILPTQSGIPGKDGVTFRPSVSENGILSWTNDQDLANPEPVDIKGPKGDSIKVSRVDESTEDGGTNVVVFSDGATLRVQNGKTGAPGENGYTPVKDKDYFDGKDGFSPTAKVEETNEGALITIEDKNGKTHAAVKHGKDGYTPIKGVDYVDGKNGKSAYEIAVDNGFEGTEEEWLEHMRSGFDSVFVVHVSIDDNYNYIADKTADEVRAAVAEGQLPIMIETIEDTSFTYLYNGEKALGSQYWPYFRTLPLDGADGHKIIMGSLLKNDKTVEASAEFPVKAVAENKLIIKYGDKETEFDGSKSETVDIRDDLFIVREKSNGVSDKTFDEVKAAFEAGKLVCMLDENYGMLTCIGEHTNPNRPGERAFMFQSGILDGTNGNKLMLTNALYAPNVIEYLAEYPVTAATKSALTIKIADKTETFDGTEAITIDLTNLGSGGSGGGLPTGGEPHQMLVTDADGNTVWDARTHYAYEEMGDVVPETTYMAADVTSNGIMIKTRVVLENGKTYTVLYNGNEYQCTATVTPAKPILAALGVTVDDSVMGGILGNLGFIDPSMATSEPFVLMVFQGVDLGNGTGEYGYIIPLDEAPEGSFAIRGMVKKYKTIDPEYLPNLKQQKTITITKNAVEGDNELYVSNVPFKEAWAMSDNELAAAIQINYGQSSNISASVESVEHLNLLGMKILLLSCSHFSDQAAGVIYKKHFNWIGDPSGDAEMITSPRVDYGFVDIRYLAQHLQVSESFNKGKTVPGILELSTMSETVKGGAKVGEGLEVVDGALRVKGLTAENANKIFYVDSEGKMQLLSLGAGLKIVDGVLTIEASTARAIAGMALAGQIKVGEV